MNVKKNGLVTALLLMSLLVTAAPGQADLYWYTWNDGNGNWSIPSNWLSPSPGTIPNSVDAGAHITGLNVTVHLDGPITLGGMEVDAGNSVVVNSDSSLILAANAMVTNNGTIRLDALPGEAKLQVAAGQTGTLKGTGKVEMIGMNSVLSGDGNLVNDTDHTIRGGGRIAASTNNKGNIIADLFSGEMLIEQPVTGTGLVSVANGSTLYLYNDLQCGRMEVWDTANLVLATNNLECGELFFYNLGALRVNDNRILDLKGFLIFNMKDTATWIWNVGSVLQMSGGGATQQSLEVGGWDYGVNAFGFNNNFNLPALTLAGSNTYVNLVDEIDNGHRPNPDGLEALYVENLTVPPGTTLNLNRIHLYTYYPNSATVYQVMAGDDAKFGGGRIINRSLYFTPAPINSLLLLSD